MTNKSIVLFAILGLVVTSCNSSNLPGATATLALIKTSTATPTLTPTFTPTLIPTITLTPTPAPISVDNAKMLVPLQTFKGTHAGWCSHLTFSPDLNRYIAYSNVSSPVTGNLAHILYDTTTGEEINTLLGPVTNTCGNAFSPDGRFLASIDDDGNLFIWDANTGEKIRELSINLNGNNSLAFSPDSKILGIASGNNDTGTIALFDSETGEPLQRINCGGWCHMIAFSPDSAIMASNHTALGNKHSIVLRDVHTGETIQSLDSPMNQNIGAISFSPDGKWLASSANRGAITLWDVANGQPVKTFDHISRKTGIPFGEMGPYALAFSPNSMILASGYGRGSIILWDVETTLPVHVFQGQYVGTDNNGVVSITFNTPGTMMVSSNRMQIATLWGLSNFPIPTSTPTKTPAAILIEVNDFFPDTNAPQNQAKINQYTFSAAPGDHKILVNTEDNSNVCFLVWLINPSSDPNGQTNMFGDSNIPGSFTINQPGDYIVSVGIGRYSNQCQPFTYTLKVTQP